MLAPPLPTVALSSRSWTAQPMVVPCEDPSPSAPSLVPKNIDTAPPFFACQYCSRRWDTWGELQWHVVCEHERAICDIPSAELCARASEGIEDIIREERKAICLGIKQLLHRRPSPLPVVFARAQCERIFLAMGFLHLADSQRCYRSSTGEYRVVLPLETPILVDRLTPVLAPHAVNDAWAIRVFCVTPDRIKNLTRIEGKTESYGHARTRSRGPLLIRSFLKTVKDAEESTTARYFSISFSTRFLRMQFDSDLVPTTATVPPSQPLPSNDACSPPVPRVVPIPACD